jgi:hypothetical protein
MLISITFLRAAPDIDAARAPRGAGTYLDGLMLIRSRCCVQVLRTLRSPRTVTVRLPTRNCSRYAENFPKFAVSRRPCHGYA